MSLWRSGANRGRHVARSADADDPAGPADGPGEPPSSPRGRGPADPEPPPGYARAPSRRDGTVDVRDAPPPTAIPPDGDPPAAGPPDPVGSPTFFWRVMGWRGLDIAVVAAVIVAAYLPYLLGTVVPGVFGFNSGLATQATGPFLGHHVGYPWIDPNVGFVSLPFGHLAASDLLHGHLPWWNPYEGVGAPLAGEGQSAALFPLTLLMALKNGQLFFHLALQLSAGIATQQLLRQMGVRRWVAIVGGVLFGLNGTFAWLVNAPFNPVAFLPVILWGIERARRKPFTEAWSAWLLIAFGVAASVYAGFPETAYLDGLFAACWAVLRLFQQPRARRLAYAGTVGIGAGVGLAVSAPFFAAFDAATKGANIGGHAGLFSTGHLLPQGLDTLGIPYLFGPIDGFSTAATAPVLNSVWGGVGGYVTAAALVMALFGLMVGRDRGLRWLMAAWIAVTVSRTFGVSLVGSVLNHIPGIAPIAFSRYSTPTWEMAVVVLACLGLDRVGTRSIEHLRNRRVAMATAGVLTLVVLGLILIPAQSVLSSLDRLVGFRGYEAAAIIWALVTTVLIVVVGITADRRVAQLAIGLILIVDAGAMFMTPQLSAPSHISVDMAPVHYLQQHQGLSRVVTLGPLTPNFGSEFGIDEVDTHDLPEPGAWARYIHAHLDPNEKPQQFDLTTELRNGPAPIYEVIRHVASYEAIGVRYVVAPSAWGRVFPRRVFHDPYVSIYELPHPAPYYRVTTGSCRLHPVSTTVVRAVCRRPAQLVRSGLDEPGWSATVSGHPVPVRHFGPLFMSVRIPAGASTVVFAYAPPELGPAEVLLGAGIVGAVGAASVPLLGAARRRRRSSGAGPPPAGPPTTDGGGLADPERAGPGTEQTPAAVGSPG
jgi:hypothetical protein